MKYPKLEGICKKAIEKDYCTGCQRLEMPNFKGLEECKNVKQPEENKEEDLGTQEKMKL